MERSQEGFKLRSLEMLVHREMKNPDFSCAQDWSNDRVPISTRPLIL